MSQALISPSEIKAIDSHDLLQQMISSNVEKVAQKVDSRIVLKWLGERKKQLKDEYTLKARNAYNEIWSVCTSKKIGHSFNTIDVKGYSVAQCNDCKYCEPALRKPVEGSINYGSDKYAYDATKSRTDNMNASLINVLAERMIELDIEAGIFEWPTEDDFPSDFKFSEPVVSKKKRKFF